ncbi:hypothetical protein D3C71_1203470 [compost metagenome]
MEIGVDQRIQAPGNQIAVEQTGTFIGTDFRLLEVVARPQFIRGAGRGANAVALETRDVMDVVVALADPDAEGLHAVRRGEIDDLRPLRGVGQAVDHRVVFVGLDAVDKTGELVGDELDLGDADALEDFPGHGHVITGGLVLLIDVTPGWAGLGIGDPDHATLAQLRQRVVGFGDGGVQGQAGQQAQQEGGVRAEQGADVHDGSLCRLRGAMVMKSAARTAAMCS